jgi:cobaltochelatase CobN
LILYLTNARTEILALRSIIEGLPEGFPLVRAADPTDLDEVPDLTGVQVVLVRLLGGRDAWREPWDELRRRCIAEGIPLFGFGGEAAPDAELTAGSTVPSSMVAQAFEYLVQGGLANFENLLRFVADTVLVDGFGFEPPVEVPAIGIYRQSESVAAGQDRRAAVAPGRAASPKGSPPEADQPPGHVAVLFYRAHLIVGNTLFVDDLCDAIEARGARVTAVWCYSLRADGDGQVAALELLAGVAPDAVITTVLVSGTATDDGLGWDAGALGALGVPILQAITTGSTAEEWESSSAGLVPMDVATRVAIPEFDGRIIAVPFAFTEQVDDGDDLGTAVVAYRTRPDRVDRVAGLATRLARLRHRPAAERKVAIVLTAYPTKRSRIGNAVALDTPASVIVLLHALVAAGYRVDRIPVDGDALMAELIDAFAYEKDHLTAAQMAGAPGRMSADAYRQWWDGVPDDARHAVEEAWGPAPGQVYVDDSSGRATAAAGAPAVSGDLVFAGLDLGGVLVAVQPPRGFGENPVAVYHSPDLPPTHHYLGFYRWLDTVWGADAIVHAGKHGTLEWLPGKSVGLSASCFPDLALGDVPLIYPFVVNDPGEGTQAKRRAHATIVDHLVPPMTRAETYDDLTRLEQLLDEHASVAALDPSKLPAIRAQVWDLLVTSEIHRDLGVEQRPDGDDFDDLVNHVDGYLCELKDAQIRGGLHILGQAPSDDAQIDLLLALTRLPQATVGSLRQEVAAHLGVDLDAAGREQLDAVEARARMLLTFRRQARAAGLHDAGLHDAGLHDAGLHDAGLHDAGPDLAGPDDAGPTASQDEAPSPAEQQVLDWVDNTLVPALDRTPDEITAVLGALDGRWVAPGPSGAPTRGMAHVLPTGRNFYSVDPKALPSRLAWDVGRGLADQLVARHIAEEGRAPTTVGVVVWGTAAMRTGGDDVAMALALLGVRPTWAAESGRVTGVEAIPAAELGRPPIDVVVRISGFFRDAFPHLVALLDDAVSLAGFGDGDPRIFGAKPGAYGSGILPLLDSRDWRTDDDLAAVYLAWGGYSYGRGGMGVPAVDAMRRRLATVEVAVKNQDNREHDIFDSDDYLQDHGGMVATIRALTGAEPKAWFGDSSNPARPRVRSLAEEAARVVRSRVLNPKWIDAMTRHGYKGAFELAATVDYLFGYDATAHVVEDWMYERVTEAYVGDPTIRKFLEQSNPWALTSMAERLLEAEQRGLWHASDAALSTLRDALLEAEGWEEGR